MCDYNIITRLINDVLEIAMTEHAAIFLLNSAYPTPCLSRRRLHWTERKPELSALTLQRCPWSRPGIWFCRFPAVPGLATDLGHGSSASTRSTAALSSGPRSDLQGSCRNAGQSVAQRLEMGSLAISVINWSLLIFPSRLFSLQTVSSTGDKKV